MSLDRIQPDPSRKHRWGDPVTERIERTCAICGSVMVTIVTPQGPLREWRNKAGKVLAQAPACVAVESPMERSL